MRMGVFLLIVNMNTTLLTILEAVGIAVAGIIGAIATILGPKLGALLGTMIDNRIALTELHNQQRLAIEQQRLGMASKTAAEAAEQEAKKHPMTGDEKKQFATETTEKIMNGSQDPDPHIEAAVLTLPPVEEAKG